MPCFHFDLTTQSFSNASPRIRQSPSRTWASRKADMPASGPQKEREVRRPPFLRPTSELLLPLLFSGFLLCGCLLDHFLLRRLLLRHHLPPFTQERNGSNWLRGLLVTAHVKASSSTSERTSKSIFRNNKSITLAYVHNCDRKHTDKSIDKTKIREKFLKCFLHSTNVRGSHSLHVAHCRDIKEAQCAFNLRRDEL